MVVASATPPTASAGRYRQHPPYKEMILRAIATLKERGGSSRTSVSKFVAATFSDLPPAHEALLSHHLRRLRDGGLLVMHRHSYKLSAEAAAEEKSYQKRNAPVMGATAKRRPGRPASRRPLSVEENRKPGRPRKGSSDGPGLRVTDTMEKRKPGRPPKVSPAKKKPGRPPKGSNRLPVAKGNSEPTVGGEKRRPGRPKGSASVTPPVDTVYKGKAGWPPKVSQDSHQLTAGKRKPGRPPKVSAESSPVPPSAVAAKRKPGRAPKTLTKSPQIRAAAKRRPGRPPKAFSEKETTEPEPSLLRRKPGRPPKASAAESSEAPVPSRRSRVSMGAPEVPFPSASLKRKPGRPPKVLPDSIREHTPGRPPKAARLHTETAAPAAALAEEKPRRGRRPPKGVAWASADKQMPVQGPPNGLEVAAAELISSPLATEMKRRPGRPKKDVASSSATPQLQENANAGGVGPSTTLVAEKRRRPRKAARD